MAGAPSAQLSHKHRACGRQGRQREDEERRLMRELCMARRSMVEKGEMARRRRSNDITRARGGW